MNDLEKFKSVVSIIKTLSADYIERLVYMLAVGEFSSENLNTLAEKEKFTDGRICPYCNSRHIVRNGHRQTDKVQRYLCRACNKSFVANTNSITSGTKKDIKIWKKYIECMMNGCTIRKTADICGIHRNTSFAWRHKILDTLQKDTDRY